MLTDKKQVSSLHGSESGVIDCLEFSERNDDRDLETRCPSDHGDHVPKVTNIAFLFILVGFSMAFVGSQAQPLLFAAIIPLVAEDLGANQLLIWFFCTQLIAIGVVAPFAGPLADLFGRKFIIIGGVLCSMFGMVLCAATPNAAGYLAGQAFTGIGIAIQELLTFAAMMEMVPARNRGFYIAILVSGFLPFAPASLYGELIAKTSWRYCGCLMAVWNLITAIIISLSYHPPPRVNSVDLSRKQLFKRIDFLGGFLSAAGIMILLVGVNSGGYTYPWKSVRVITFLTSGGFLLVMFLVYESWFAPHPMFPRRLLQFPRTFLATITVILMAGINYIPILFFWVMQSVAVYDSNKLQAGVRTLPFGFCILGGAFISAILVSTFPGHIRLIMTTFCVIQAAGIGCMAAVDPTNISTVWAPLTLGLVAVGGVLIPNQLIISLICPDDLIGTATSLTVSLRAVGQVVGTSIFYNQFVSVLTKNTYQYVVPAAVELGIYNSTTLKNMMPTLLAIPFPEYAKSLPELHTPEQIASLHEAIIIAFSHSFSRVYYVSLAFGVIAVVASLLTGNLSKTIDMHIAVAYF